MPVINLPKDTRWGDLGAGLGGGIAQILEAYGKKQATEGVAQIMQDPSVAEDKKQTEAYKQFGPQGSAIYKEFVTAQVLGATVIGKKAEAAKDLAAASAPQARSDFLSRLMGGGGQSAAPAAASTTPTSPVEQAVAPTASATPSQSPVAAALGAPAAAAPAAAATSAPTSGGMGGAIFQTIDQLAAAGGVTVSPAEKQALLPAIGMALFDKKDHLEPIREFIKVKQTGAKFPSELSSSQSAAATAAEGAKAAPAVAAAAATKAPLGVAAAQAVAPTVGPKAVAETQSSINAANSTTPTGTAPADVGDVYSSFTPEQNQAVATAAQTGGAKAAGEAIQSFVTVNTAAARSGDPALREKIVEIGSKITTFTRVLDDIETNPKLQGGSLTSVMYPVLAKYGFDFGQIPPAMYAEGATTDQLALQALQGHKGFGGAFLVPFVDKTMPTIAKQKILKAVETQFASEQYLNELTSTRLAAVDKGQSTTQIDAEIKKAEVLRDRAGTLWWTGGDNARVFYKGREINPDTWVPVEGGAREFAPKDYLKVGNDSVTGADLNARAKANGITPEEYYARVRAQRGAQ